MMPDLLNQQDEFIAMLDQYGKAYKNLGNGLIIVACDQMLNIRQYHSDGFYLSSWVKVNDFKEKLEELLK
jgi:hypothetical protein